MFKYQKNQNNSLTVYDPVHGAYVVPEPFSEIIQTKEMQRLKFISQNGFSQLEFLGLEQNDRLSHSVGAYYIMTKILDRLEFVLKQYGIKINQDDKDVALCSMLLHDIGHGPFSHSLEIVTNYSHEKRTTDIILGDTEISELLNKLFGPQKVREIASFIAEINNQNDLKNDSFTKLLKNLVSHQLDADRLDYLKRDAYYARVLSTFDLDNIISNINVIVNSNQEYELVIGKKALSSIENVLIQRFQMYRDVYLSPISVLGDELFNELMKKYRTNDELHTIEVPHSLRVLASDPQVKNRKDFLKMIDQHFKESFKILAKNKRDRIVAYLSDFSNLEDYILIENEVQVSKLLKALEEIFPDYNLKDTISIIHSESKVKLYKKEEKLNIDMGNRIMDITECTNLIRPQEVLEINVTFFNPKLLQLELGLTDEEFKKYESEINRMLEEFNKKPEEFELKYIIDELHTAKDMEGQLLKLFLDHGFHVVSTKNVENCDEYFDTFDFELYQNSGSLRIRKSTKNGKEAFKGTYKEPISLGEVYSSRTEIEDPLKENSFEALKEKMLEKEANISFSKMRPQPVLNSTTKRKDITFEKNGVKVCLSIDQSVYTNHLLFETMDSDRMIEIEAKGDVKNRIILNEIHSFVNDVEGLSINKQSKYERGMGKTITSYYSFEQKKPLLSKQDQIRSLIKQNDEQ